MMTALSREHTRQARQRSSSGRWEATCSSSASSKSAKLAMALTLEGEQGRKSRWLVERGGSGGSSNGGGAQAQRPSPAARTLAPLEGSLAAREPLTRCLRLVVRSLAAARAPREQPSASVPFQVLAIAPLCSVKGLAPRNDTLGETCHRCRQRVAPRPSAESSACARLWPEPVI